MAASLMELLTPQVVLRVISRIKDGRGPLASWLGFHADKYNDDVSLSGPNTTRNPGGSVRNVTYRIFDNTRTTTSVRAPGTPAAIAPQNPMGQNTVSILRFHEAINLNYEFLGNLSRMIGPNSQIDEGGETYIGQQTTYLAQRANNVIEMMAAGMMRDSLYAIIQGDNWLPSFNAPTGTQVGFQIPFLIPSGNKNQLNMLSTGNIIAIPWNNPDAPIIGNLQQIIAAYAQLSRFTMTDVWINSLMWINVITNTQVRNLAGSANTPFAEFDMEEEAGMNESGPANKYSAVLRGQPTVMWHFCDDTLALGGGTDPSYIAQPATPAEATLYKLVPDNMAIFCTKPSKQWTTMYLGGEYIVENPGMPANLKMGWAFWHMYMADPSCVKLMALLNAVPALFVPNVIAPATVIY